VTPPIFEPATYRSRNQLITTQPPRLQTSTLGGSFGGRKHDKYHKQIKCCLLGVSHCAFYDVIVLNRSHNISTNVAKVWTSIVMFWELSKRDAYYRPSGILYLQFLPLPPYLQLPYQHFTLRDSLLFSLSIFIYRRHPTIQQWYSVSVEVLLLYRRTQLCELFALS